MKVLAVVLLLALAGAAVAQNVTEPVEPTAETTAAEANVTAPAEPEPMAADANMTASDPAAAEPAAVEATPAEPAATEPTTAEPAAAEPATAEPAAEPAAAAAVPAAAGLAKTAANSSAPHANITDNRVAKYYSSPLYAMESIPQLSGLTGLVKKSSLGPTLSSKNLLATIFAPTNDAVDAATGLLESANITADKATIDSILKYHVAEGASLVLSRFKDGQELSMLDKAKTTISVDGGEAAAPKRFFMRLLLQSEPTYYISSDAAQKVKISAGNIQGGKSQIHLIDGVLLPQSFLTEHNITAEQLEGLAAAPTNGTAAEEATAEDDAAAADAADKADADKAAEPAAAPAESPAPAAAPKSSAAKAVATLLAAPVLLAVLML